MLAILAEVESTISEVTKSYVLDEYYMFVKRACLLVKRGSLIDDIACGQFRKK